MDRRDAAETARLAGSAAHFQRDFVKTRNTPEEDFIGADAYLLSHVIHDWNEDHCLTILRNCRAAMTPTSRLLVIELMLREGNAPASAARTW